MIKNECSLFASDWRLGALIVVTVGIIHLDSHTNAFIFMASNRSIVLNVTYRILMIVTWQWLWFTLGCHQWFDKCFAVMVKCLHSDGPDWQRPYSCCKEQKLDEQTQPKHSQGNVNDVSWKIIETRWISSNMTTSNVTTVEVPLFEWKVTSLDTHLYPLLCRGFTRSQCTDIPEAIMSVISQYYSSDFINLDDGYVLQRDHISTRSSCFSNTNGSFKWWTVSCAKTNRFPRWFDIHSVPKLVHILEPKHVDLSLSGNQQILIFQGDIGLIWCSMEKGYWCQFYKCCQVSVCIVSKFVAVEIKDRILCWTIDDDALLDHIRTALKVYAFRSVIFEWLGFNCYIGLCPNESKVNRGGMGNLFLALVIVPNRETMLNIEVLARSPIKLRSRARTGDYDHGIYWKLQPIQLRKLQRKSLIPIGIDERCEYLWWSLNGLWLQM